MPANSHDKAGAAPELSHASARDPARGSSRSTSRPASPWARRRSSSERHARVVVDRPRRAGGARSAGPADPPAHVGRPRADRARLPVLRRTAARPSWSRGPRALGARPRRARAARSTPRSRRRPRCSRRSRGCSRSCRRRRSRRRRCGTSRCCCSSRRSSWSSSSRRPAASRSGSFAFDEPVDPGSRAGRREYLNEQRRRAAARHAPAAARGSRTRGSRSASARSSRSLRPGVHGARAGRAAAVRRRRRRAARRAARRTSSRPAARCWSCSSGAPRCSR